MMRRQRAIRYAFLSQLSLWGFLTVCTILMPHFLFERNEGGVSNYGVHALTVVPYTLAFGLGGSLMLAAARTIPQNIKTSRREVQIVLSTLGCLLLLVLLTTYPYKVNRSLDNLHIFTSILFFVAELFAAVWIVTRLVADRANITLLTIQIFGSLLSLLTLMGRLHVLFISQFVVGLSFGWLLVRTLSQAFDTPQKR
jgi:hypothetical protein